MKLTVDTNILVYLIDIRDPVRQESALAIVNQLGLTQSVLTLQSLAEFHYAALRKRLAPREVIADQYRQLRTLFGEPVPSSVTAMERALVAWSAGRFGFWDAVMLATASEYGCDAMISEDMADGAVLDRVRVIAAFDAAGAVSPGARAALGLA